MVSYMVNGWAGYLCSALAWPLLLSTEYKRGMAIQRQLQLVGAAEALHLFFLLMAKYGGMAALGSGRTCSGCCWPAPGAGRR